MNPQISKSDLTSRLVATPVLAFVLAAVCVADDASHSPSLSSRVPFARHIERQFFLRDGLPSSWVNDIVQTRDDYVWIATDNGLSRYDGLRFRAYERSASEQMPYQDIRELFEDSQGSLWIGTKRGLARYRPGRPGKLESVPSVHNKSVRAIFEDRSGALWIGTENETLVTRDGRTFHIVEDAPTNVRAICQDRNGQLWFGSHFGLFRRQDSIYEQISHPRLPLHTSADKGVPQSRVNALLVGDDGALWIGANRALLHMQDGEFTTRGRELGLQQIYDILQTRTGGLYVAARFGVYRCVDDGPFEHVSEEPSALCAMEDREGGLWIGHGDNRGLRYYRNSHIETAWTDARVRCAYVDAEGNIWFGSNQGLHRLSGGLITDYGISEGLPDPRVQTITQSSDRKLWIGTAKGLAQWSGKAITPAANPPELAKMNIGVVFEDSKGTLWFSLASAGAFTLKVGALTELQALKDGRVNWFWESPDGTIWIGHESGLFQRSDGRLKQLTDSAVQQLLNPRMLCHFSSDDGTLWIGTSNGILRHRSGRLDAFLPECGIRADNIERLTADEAGRLWYGGRDGLFQARIADLEAVADGRAPHLQCDRVEGFDRFPPLSAFSQGCFVKDDMLWIVADQGLVKLPMEPFRRRQRDPRIHLERATIDGAAADFADRFAYLAGRRRLSIHFAVPEFIRPASVQVRYRLDGHDQRWIDAGSDRVAFYTDLRPGEYRFRVSARTGIQEWVEADPPIDFSVQPRWWETIWFRALVAVGMVSIAICTSWGYTRNVRRRNALLRDEIDERKRLEADRQLAEERARDYLEQLARMDRAASMGEMATSIAHEVNQPLFAIVSNAETALRLLDREQLDMEEIRDALGDIVDDGNRASSVVDHVRSRVRKQSRPTERLDLNQIAREAAQFAHRAIHKQGLSLSTDLANDLPLVEGDPVELQQVVLNFIINGAQAMGTSADDAREISLRTSAQNGLVELSVSDQGRGFDEEMIDRLFDPFFTTKPGGTGMGLAINRTIIEAHNGRIWATLNDDVGATFHFCLPSVEQ